MQGGGGKEWEKAAQSEWTLIYYHNQAVFKPWPLVHGGEKKCFLSLSPDS